MNRNLKVYPIFRFLLNMLIIGPILIPFLRWKGLDYSQIMLLQTISALSAMVFEVPTGAVADKLTRKLSLVISGFILSAAILIYILADEFIFFTVSEVLFGLGLTFSSGADSAILYESLRSLGREKEYQKREGSAASNIFLGQAVFSILSGYLYMIHPTIPFWISVIFLASGSFAALFFKEPDRTKSPHRYLKHIWISFSEAVKKPRILWLLFFAALFGSLIRLGYWLYQPYFDLVSLEIVYYGYIFAGMNIIAALSSKYLLKRVSHLRPRRVLLSLACLMSVSFLLPGFLKAWWLIGIICLQQLFRGMYPATMRFYVNNQVKDDFRATTISLVSLVSSLSFALISPLIGNGLDVVGTQQVYRWVGYISVAGLLFLFFLRRRQKQRKREYICESS
ncbi:MAG TPA: MFS transporter [Thermotogota bacterium]|nr:MFS transporter [Thermotogota bacterium]